MSFRAYIHTLLKTGLTTPEIVNGNIQAYDRALDEWNLQCSLNQKDELIHTVEYGEEALRKQLPYGMNRFAGLLISGFTEAKTLAGKNQCGEFKGHFRIRSELNKLKASLR